MGVYFGINSIKLIQTTYLCEKKHTHCYSLLIPLTITVIMCNYTVNVGIVILLNFYVSCLERQFRTIKLSRNL